MITEADGRYSISSEGRVYSNVAGKIRKPVNWGSGYYYVHVRNALGKDLLLPIHRLVAKYFVANPYGLTQVNHIDGNKHNNHFSNLEWVSPIENTQHAIQMGLTPSRNKSVLRITDAGDMVAYDSIKNAAKDTGINYDNIRSALYRGCRAGGFYWMFNEGGVV